MVRMSFGWACGAMHWWLGTVRLRVTSVRRAGRRRVGRRRVCSRGARAWRALDGRGGGTFVNLVDVARNQVPSVQRVRGRFKNRVMLLWSHMIS